MMISPLLHAMCPAHLSIERREPHDDPLCYPSLRTFTSVFSALQGARMIYHVSPAVPPRHHQFFASADGAPPLPSVLEPDDNDAP